MGRDYRGYIGVIWDYIGIFRDSGKEHGNYYNGLYRGYIGYILELFKELLTPLD